MARVFFMFYDTRDPALKSPAAHQLAQHAMWPAALAPAPAPGATARFAKWAGQFASTLGLGTKVASSLASRRQKRPVAAAAAAAAATKDSEGYFPTVLRFYPPAAPDRLWVDSLETLVAVYAPPVPAPVPAKISVRVDFSSIERSRFAFSPVGDRDRDAELACYYTEPAADGRSFVQTRLVVAFYEKVTYSVQVGTAVSTVYTASASPSTPAAPDAQRVAVPPPSDDTLAAFNAKVPRDCYVETVARANKPRASSLSSGAADAAPPRVYITAVLDPSRALNPDPTLPLTLPGPATRAALDELRKAPGFALHGAAWAAVMAGASATDPSATGTQKDIAAGDVKPPPPATPGTGNWGNVLLFAFPAAFVVLIGGGAMLLSRYSPASAPPAGNPTGQQPSAMTERASTNLHHRARTYNPVVSVRMDNFGPDTR
jgi:hypothetical protein